MGVAEKVWIVHLKWPHSLFTMITGAVLYCMQLSLMWPRDFYMFVQESRMLSATHRQITWRCPIYDKSRRNSVSVMRLSMTTDPGNSRLVPLYWLGLIKMWPLHCGWHSGYTRSPLWCPLRGWMFMWWSISCGSLLSCNLVIPT